MYYLSTKGACLKFVKRFRKVTDKLSTSSLNGTVDVLPLVKSGCVLHWTLFNYYM